LSPTRREISESGNSKTPLPPAENLTIFCKLRPTRRNLVTATLDYGMVIADLLTWNSIGVESRTTCGQ
jgi:hypothetical protein